MDTPSDAERVQALVPRCSREETTVARVGCARSAQVGNAADLHRQLTAAVTCWVRQTESGRAAYAGSSEDYNVGDRGGDLGDPDLLRLLAAHGVRDLTIEIVTSDETLSGWTYDTPLVDPSGLEAPGDDAGLNEVPELTRRILDVERGPAPPAGPGGQGSPADDGGAADHRRQPR
jgi:hypothetical protein